MPSKKNILKESGGLFIILWVSAHKSQEL